MDELERQLRDKATEIHETALLGKQLLQQQESLYAKVASLAPADYSPASPASPGVAPAALDSLQDDLAQLHSTSPTSPAQLRRSRNTNNAQRTSNDIELATSIGTSLLAEVRRLQALLLEKEAILRDEQLNKEAALSACESEKRLKERGEQLSEKLKEELWTQELLAQELRTTLTTLQTQSTKSELLLTRQSKDLLATKDTNEFQKTEIERLTVGMEEMKNKFDLEMALMRKSQAGILREKSDLRAVLDGLQNDKRRGFKRENSLLSREMDSPSDAGPRYIDEEEDEDEVARRGRRKTGDGLERMSKDDLFKEFNQLDQELEEHDSFDGSPAVRRHGSTLLSSHPADVKLLQASLATAEQKIAQLQADLAATRSTTTQSNYLPADDHSSYSPRGSLELNEEWENSSDQSHSGLYGTPRRISLSGPTGTGRGRGRGRGRGGRGASASGGRMGSRLSVGGGDLSIGEADESVDTLERNTGEADSREPSTSPGGIFSHQFVQQNYEEEYDDEDDYEGSENGSIMSSPQANGSFQDSPLGRNGRRSNRNSLVGKSNRPTSGMFSNSPGGFVALGAGVGAVAAAGSLMARDSSTNTVVSPTKEAIREAIVWKDMGIMTEPLPPPPLPPIVVVKETKEITTQTEIVLPPVVAKSEIAIQTDYVPPPLPPAPIPVPVVVLPAMVDAETEIKPVAIKMVERGILTDRVNIPLLPVPFPLPLPIPVKKVKMSNQSISTDPLPPIIVVSTKEAGVSTLPLPIPVVVPVIPRPTQSIATSMDQEFLQRGRSVGHAQTEVQIAVVDFDSADDEDDEEDATHRFYMTSREGRGVGESETDAGAETDFQDANEDPSPLLPGGPFLGAPGTKRDFLVSSTTTTPTAARTNRQSLSPDLSANNRGSINTFGLPDPSAFSTPSSIEEDPIEVSAAVAAEFTRKEENGLMGPPLSTKPRASTLTSISTRSNRSSIVSGSATGPQRPLSPPPNDLLIRAQSPAFDEIYARRGLLNVPNRSGGRGTASAGNLRGGGSESEGNETVVAGQGRPEGMGRYPPSSALVGGVSRTGGKRKNVDYSDTLSFSDLDDYSQTPAQQRGASHPVSRTQSGAGTTNGRASMESGRTSEMEHMYLPSTGVARPPVPPKPYPSPSRTRPSANSTTLQTPRNRPSQAQSQANADDEASASTDPALIHAITQTMIGEFLHKYTRKPIGKGIVGGKRHERFFWVHPYTKMLYWSGRDPGAQNGGGENRSKSVLIMGVRQIVDPNPYPEGLHSASIIIETSNRDITITASSRERHDMWFNAINFLLARPDVASESTPRKQYSSSTRSQTRKTFSSESFSSRKFPAVNRLVGTFGNRSESRLGNRSESRLGSRSRGEYIDGESDEDDINRTAKGKGKASVQSTYKKRSDRAPSAYEAELAGLSTTPRSIRTYRSVNSLGQKRSGNASGTERSDGEGFDIVARTERGERSEMDDEDFFEGLENVRACCGGKHDVGSLSRKNHSHSHSHRQRVQSDVEGEDYHSSRSHNHSKTSVATTPSMRSNHTGRPSVGASSTGRNKLSLPTFRGKDYRTSAAMASSSSASSRGSPVIGRN